MQTENTFGLPTGKAAWSIAHATKRLNIWHGAVRSSKSVNSDIAFSHWVKNEAPRGDLVICGKTRDTIKRNVLYPLLELVGKENLKFSVVSGEGILYGRRFHIIGGVDESSEFRLRGLTLAGALVDEGTIIPESFFKMLLTRLSVDGARLYLTTNPDAPGHWLKEKYIDNLDIDDKIVFHFSLEDNPFLSKKYIENIKKEFTGLWYQRFIEGKWVMAEGIVYDAFLPEKHIIDKMSDTYDHFIAGVDYGTNTICVFLLFGVKDNKIYCIKEYYYDAKKHNRQKTDGEYSKDMKTFLGDIKPKNICVDPSAASFIVQLRRDGFTNVKEANNEVLDGIRTVSNLLTNGRLFIHPSCKELIKEFSSYVWDDKAQEKGEDKPLKQFDHCVDSLRYALHTNFKFNAPKAIKNFL